MRPDFALEFTADRVGLFHRSAAGVWHELGGVAFDDPEMAERLAVLRRTATAIARRGFATKLVIPNHLVLYAQIEAPGPNPADIRDQIRAALEPMLPLPVSEVEFDWSGEGPVRRVAVAERAILDQAEELALEHSMNPVCIVAAPEAGAFAGEVLFRQTDYAQVLLGPDAVIERDQAPFRPGPRLADEAELAAAGNASPPLAPAANGATDPALAPDPDAAPVDAEPEAGDEGDLEAIIAPLVREVRRAPPRAASEGRSGARRGGLAGLGGRLKALAGSLGSRIGSTIGRLAGRRKARRVAAPPSGEDRPAPPTPDLAEAAPAPAPIAATQGAAAVPAGPAEPATPRALSTEPANAAAIEGMDKLAAGPAPPQAASDGWRMPVFTSRRAGAAAVALLAFGMAAGAAGYLALRTPDDSVVLAPTLPAPPEAAPALTKGSEGKAEPDSTTQARAKAEAPALPASPPRPAAAPADAPLPAPTLAAVPPLRPLPRPEERAPDTAEILDTLGPEELAALAEAGIEPPAGAALTPSEVLRTAPVLDALTGALISAPPIAAPPPPDTAPELSGFDPPAHPQDPLALPRLVTEADPALEPVPNPPPAGTRYAIDERGFIRATPEGVITPEGIRVVAGRPAVVPPREKPLAPQLVRQAALAKVKPRPRPADLGSRMMTARFGGRTPEELARLRPRARPDSAQSLAESEASGDAQDASVVAASPIPKARPADFAKRVAAIRDERGRKAAIAATGAKVATAPAAAPAIPTRTSVARQATIRNAIDLSTLNLVGVYGTPSNRRALLRLPTGRYVKVKVGDRLAGGRIAAIGDTSVSYVKGGRAQMLELPGKY